MKRRTSKFSTKLILVILFALLSALSILAQTQSTHYRFWGQVFWMNNPQGVSNISYANVVLKRKLNGNVIGFESVITDETGVYEFRPPCALPGETYSFGVIETDGSIKWNPIDYPFSDLTDTNPNSPFYLCEGTSNNISYFQYMEYYGSSPMLQNPQNSGWTCPMQSVGGPVNVTNGNMWLQQTDYSLSGIGEKIQVTRTYNSSIQNSGIFGVGWSTNYDERLLTSNDNFIQLSLSSGQVVYFGQMGNNSFTSLTRDFYGQLLKNNDNTFTLTFKDGRIHNFLSNGKLSRQQDRTGNQTTLGYDSNGDLMSITDATGRNLAVASNSGRIVELTDSLGVVASYNYNSDGTLQSVNYPDGSKYQFDYTTIGGKIYLATVRDALNNILETHQYDAEGHATTSEKQGGVEKYTLDYTHLNDSIPYTIVTDALGKTTKYTFNRSKGRNVITKLEGSCACGSGSQTTQYIYDDKLNLTKIIDALGHQTTYTYDTNGNPLTISDPVGTETYTYNNLGQILTKTDRMGGIWTNTYDSQGNLTKTVDALGSQAFFYYNALGLPYVVNKINSAGKIWGMSWTYDAYGNVIEIEERNGKKRLISYDTRSRVTSITDALGYVVTLEYDLVNRLKKITDPDLKTVEQNYDLAGRLSSVTNQRGFITNYSYDGAYRRTSVTDALNHTTNYGYDLMSNLISQTDPLGNVTNYEYDEFNQLEKIIYPPAATGALPLLETFEYDTVGNVKKKIDTAGRQALFDYDNANRLIKTTDANNQITRFEYNQYNQTTKVTDPLNQVYEFTYDALGRVLTQSRAGSTMSYTYDFFGNQLSRTDYNGDVTTYTYDIMNRLKSINYPNSAENVNFTYDALHRLQTATNYAGTVNFNYTNRNQVSQVIDVHGKKVNYSYDPAGNPNKMLLDDVEQIDYQFDRVNRLQKITDSEDGTFVDYNYDAANRLIKKILPNGVSTAYQYNGMSRLTRLRDFKTNSNNTQTNLYNRQYSYNTANNISQIKIGSQTTNYSYNSVDRLTQVTSTDTQQNENYNFDAVGNRSSSHLSSNYNYQPFNKVLTSQQASYVYDAKGNMVSKTDSIGTTQFVWDYENRLRQVIKPGGSSVNYKYDALGKRVERSVGADSTKFTYDGQNVLLDQHSDGTSVKYVNGLGIDNKIRQTVNGQAQYFTQDHLGSTNALTDSSGNVVSSASYDSFGNANGSLNTRYQFTGREVDDFTGLHYYRTRWYDSNLGRFMSEDLLGLAAGINQFAYVGNNPVNKTDPSGLYDFGAAKEIVQQAAPPVVAAGGTIAGVVVGSSVVIPAVIVGVGAVIIGAVYIFNENYIVTSRFNIFVNGPLNPFAAWNKLMEWLYPPPGIKCQPQPVPQTQKTTPSPTPTPDDEYVMVYHGSIDDASKIRMTGLIPPADGLPTYVTRDLRLAQAAVGPRRYEINQGIAKDPGIIASRIPKKLFDSAFRIEPEGEVTAWGMKSTEIKMRYPIQYQIFNTYMVRY